MNNTMKAIKLNDHDINNTVTLICTVLVASVPILLYKYGPKIILALKSYKARRRIRSIIAVQSAGASETNENGANGPIVTGLYIHPIKSLRPVSLTSTSFDKHGLRSDRRLMIVRPNPMPIYGSFVNGEATHRFVTQRQCSKFATIEVSEPVEVNGRLMIKLSCELIKEHVYIDVTPKTIANLPVRYFAGIWGDTLSVADVGDEAAVFVAKVATIEDPTFKDVRVVAILEDSERRVDEIYCPDEARVGLFGGLPQSGFTDGFPILVAAESSLAELNRKLSEKHKNPIQMSRFRPNIVISNTKPFDEDNWKAIQIGTGPKATVLHITKGCPRCKQSCTDQLTGERSEEPLETLSDFRAFNGDDVYFAQNAVLNGDSYGGVISVGDEVRILTRGDAVWDVKEVPDE